MLHFGIVQLPLAFFDLGPDRNYKLQTKDVPSTTMEGEPQSSTPIIIGAI